MKQMTIWQRLNTALAVLILLLMTGVGLALWIEKTAALALHRSDELDGTKNLIHFDLTLMSDALRGMLVDPQNEVETKSRNGAITNLTSTLDGLAAAHVKYPEMVRSVRKLRDFTTGSLIPFHNDILETLKTDPPAAIAEYNANHPGVRRQRDELFFDLTQQIELIQKSEAVRARTIAIVGLSCMVLVLGASFLVGRFQSSAVTEPLNRLVGSLELMRQGDFRERLALQRNDEFGILSDGLNRLADDLSEVVGQVQRSGIQVNTTATQIAATAREQQSTASEIAATTAQIGATSKEISATSKELVKTMNEVNHVAEETASLAGSGQTAIGRMESTMRHIMEASGSITSKLAVLN